MDEELQPGTPTWSRVIEREIEGCAVVPARHVAGRSSASVWVDREIDLAQELTKPIMPLLDRGASVPARAGHAGRGRHARVPCRGAAFVAQVKRLVRRLRPSADPRPDDPRAARRLQRPLRQVLRHDRAPAPTCGPLGRPSARRRNGCPGRGRPGHHSRLASGPGGDPPHPAPRHGRPTHPRQRPRAARDERWRPG